MNATTSNLLRNPTINGTNTNMKPSKDTVHVFRLENAFWIYKGELDTETGEDTGFGARRSDRYSSQFPERDEDCFDFSHCRDLPCGDKLAR